MQIVNAFFWSDSNSKIFYLVLVWIFFEFLRSILFTGLPWNLIGYSWSWSLIYSQAVSILGHIWSWIINCILFSKYLFIFINNKSKPYLLLQL